MRKISSHFKLPEANELKQTYSSWIGKKAYMTDGKMETLQSITVRPSGDISIRGQHEKGYVVDFEFANKKRLSANEFLEANGLAPVHHSFGSSSGENSRHRLN